jgi:DMSO/TMAO reductase YedYZ molybdopterin-dependent catalytic subunit
MSVRLIGLQRAAGLLALVLALTTTAVVRGQATPASPAAPPIRNAPPAPQPVAEIVAQLVVAGDVSKPLSLSADDLRHLPRTTVTVTNEHQGDSKEVYEGVLLSVLLKQAGAPQLKGPAMAAYALAEGADGYRVSFSLAELDPGFQDSQVLVADSMNGEPLGDKVGPLRLIVPQDKRPARWVRMLRSIKVINSAPK